MARWGTVFFANRELWLGLYAGVAWIYFKVVGYPVRKIISHFHRYNAKVMPKWQIVLYVFISIYCSTGTTIISIEEKIFDITPVMVMLPILIYYQEQNTDAPCVAENLMVMGFAHVVMQSEKLCFKYCFKQCKEIV